MSLTYDIDTGYLVPGMHHASWSDMIALCSGNAHRSRLAAGLRSAALNLRGAGCRIILLDGSFVSEKDLPNDYDGAWDPTGVDPNLVDPVLLDFGNRRVAMKAKYGGELFPATSLAAIRPPRWPQPESCSATSFKSTEMETPREYCPWIWRASNDHE